MTVNHPESEAPTWCEDYDPNFKLHGCELEPHAADKPHRDLLGNKWTESLTLPCPSVSDEGKPCGLHFGHFPAKHRPAGAEVWSEDEWTDAIYEASGPHKSATAEAATLQAGSIQTGTAAATYEGQLAERAAELLPGLGTLSAPDFSHGIEELAGLIDFQVGAWHDFGYETPPTPECKPVPPPGERSAQAIKAGHEAIEAIDELTRQLYALREQLVGELRQDSDVRADRVDAMLARLRQERQS
jgi:hypothetical protein